jgi:pyruvate carboxylase
MADYACGSIRPTALTAIGKVRDDGRVEVFFELNGQPRTIEVTDRNATSAVAALRKIDGSNPGHIGAPMSGVVSTVRASKRQFVQAGDAF